MNTKSIQMTDNNILEILHTNLNHITSSISTWTFITISFFITKSFSVFTIFGTVSLAASMVPYFQIFSLTLASLVSAITFGKILIEFYNKHFNKKQDGI